MIFDAHLDLSMNALEWNRNLRQSVSDIRKQESGKIDLPGREMGTVAFPDMRKGGIGLCVATQIARYVKPSNPLPGWHSPEQAWAHTQGQLAWYREMEAAGEMRQIRNVQELEAHLINWSKDPKTTPIGYILSLEGADSIVTMGHLEKAHAEGLRAVGPAHYGPGTYAFGTDSVGSIGEKGKVLLTEMMRLNIILDATHLCDQSFWEAMDHYEGPVWASHSNCRSLVDHNRQFNDDQLKELINRGAVIGAALDAWMMVPNWQRGISTPAEMNVTLAQMADNIDHICQLAGNAKHVGIGTDLDGGFGKEQSPSDVDTIADIGNLATILANRGYSADDIEGVMWRNWVDFLRRAW